MKTFKFRLNQDVHVVPWKRNGRILRCMRIRDARGEFDAYDVTALDMAESNRCFLEVEEDLLEDGHRPE